MESVVCLFLRRAKWVRLRSSRARCRSPLFDQLATLRSPLPQAPVSLYFRPRVSFPPVRAMKRDASSRRFWRRRGIGWLRPADCSNTRMLAPPGHEDSRKRRGKVPLLSKDQGPRSSSAAERVAIIGGSTAGFFTASLLARRGLSVRVFEQAEQLDPAPRTLIVTHRMRELLGAQAEPSVVNEIHRFEMFTDGRAATVALDRPDLIVERARLIRGLAAQAQNDGAQIAMGRRFMGVQSAVHGNGNGNGHGAGAPLQLTLGVSGSAQTEQIDADTVIGADGAQSRVAQAAGWPRQRTVPLIQAIVKMPGDMPPDSVRVWFVPGDTPYFYWLIPESKETAALGLIGEDGHHARECLDRFMEKRHFEPLSFQAARIPVYEGWVPVERRLGAGRLPGQGQHRRRNRHGFPRRARRLRNYSRWRPQPRVARPAPRTRSAPLYSPHPSSFRAGRLQPLGGFDERRNQAFAQPLFARRSRPRSLAFGAQPAAPAASRPARFALRRQRVALESTLLTP